MGVFQSTTRPEGSKIVFCTQFGEDLWVATTKVRPPGIYPPMQDCGDGCETPDFCSTLQSNKSQEMKLDEANLGCPIFGKTQAECRANAVRLGMDVESPENIRQAQAFLKGVKADQRSFIKERRRR